MKCPYCKAAQGRCATTSSGRSVTECSSCGRVVEERHSQPHHLFLLRAQDSPLCLVTPDLPSLPPAPPLPPHHHQSQNQGEKEKEEEKEEDEDPFEPCGFITTFSTWSLEHSPVFVRSSLSFSGHLAELERVLESSSSSSGPAVVVDNLRAYLQIIDVASILGLDYDISDHAFQLFRDCSSATCLRNRSVEALATAALVQAIREAQEPRTLQEISIAANLPQKEIGKYIKILGEALQLSQPINSNSITVHMPRFCTLLQLNKSAQELATHIGEVVINKCFCTRRNPISISAAAIYLACQLEDKRKTQAEICKVTGLTEVTLRKVYKELLENWDDLLPSNYTPAVPPEKAFPTTTIASGRSLVSRVDLVEVATSLEKDKQPETKTIKPIELPDTTHHDKANDGSESKSNVCGANTARSRGPVIWQPQQTLGISGIKAEEDHNQSGFRGIDMNMSDEQMGEKDTTATASAGICQFSGGSSIWQFQPPSSSDPSAPMQYVKPSTVASIFPELKGAGNLMGSRNKEQSRNVSRHQ